MDLVPIKVKIGLRPNKHADHPDWQKLPLALTENPADHMSSGWHYDKSCGHAEAGLDSPIGMQWGMIFVTALFAEQAVATFPALVTIMTEVEAQDFWDSKCTAHIPENKIDTTTLQGLQAELALRKELNQDVTELNTKIAKALDPADAEPGIKKDKKKKFVDAKVLLDINVVSV